MRIWAGVCICVSIFAAQAHAQEVVVVREKKIAQHPEPPAEGPTVETTRIEKAIAVQPVVKPTVAVAATNSAKLTVEQMRAAGAVAAQRKQEEPNSATIGGFASQQILLPSKKEYSTQVDLMVPAKKISSGQSGMSTSRKEIVAAAMKKEVTSPTPDRQPAHQPEPVPSTATVATSQHATPPSPVKKEVAMVHSQDRQPAREPEPLAQPVSFSGPAAFMKLADGFDFPVGKPEAQGYYKARGFRAHGHLGEDWDGVGGGNTDLGDPIYCIGDGIVVFARDCHQGWGNVIIVRHAYRDGLGTKNVDSLYGHLEKILVRRGQAVKRGQKIATMGTAHGLYDAHLHLEVRKNITIGMSRDKFAQDLSNYYEPSQFILSHRHLQGGGGNYRVAMNTFKQDENIPWDKLRNYSHAHSGGGTSESAYALKRALASQNASH